MYSTTEKTMHSKSGDSLLFPALSLSSGMTLNKSAPFSGLSSPITKKLVGQMNFKPCLSLNLYDF